MTLWYFFPPSKETDDIKNFKLFICKISEIIGKSTQGSEWLPLMELSELLPMVCTGIHEDYEKNQCHCDLPSFGTKIFSLTMKTAQ